MESKSTLLPKGHPWDSFIERKIKELPEYAGVKSRHWNLSKLCDNDCNVGMWITFIPFPINSNGIEYQPLSSSELKAHLASEEGQGGLEDIEIISETQNHEHFIIINYND